MAIEDLSDDEKEFIVEAHHAGCTPAEITDELFGHQHTTIRRYLSEQGLIHLKWHKSAQEFELLEYLFQNGVKTISDLKSAIHAGVL